MNRYLLFAVGCALIAAGSAQIACSDDSDCSRSSTCVNGQCFPVGGSCILPETTTSNFDNFTSTNAGFPRVMLGQSTCATDEVCVPLNGRTTGACATIDQICIDDADCDAGICIVGYCAQIPCRTADDCPYTNATCSSDGICRRPSLTFCETDGDCVLLDQVCTSLICHARTVCTANVECSSPRDVCVNGGCFLSNDEPTAPVVQQPAPSPIVQAPSSSSSCSTLRGCPACTATAGCGLCRASGLCLEGTADGPTNGACPSRSWAFTLLDCPSG